MFKQNSRIRIMSERNHVSRSSLCVMRHNGTGTAIDSDIDGVDLPPPNLLGFPHIGYSKNHTLSIRRLLHAVFSAES